MPPGVTGFVHIGLVVEDLGETVRFLGVLGFDCTEPAVHGGGWIDRIVGLADVTIESVMVRGPDGGDVFEVVRFRSPTAGAQRAGTGREPPGAPARRLQGRRHPRRRRPRPRGRLGHGRRDRRLRGHVPPLLRPRARGSDRRARRAARPLNDKRPAFTGLLRGDDNDSSPVGRGACCVSSMPGRLEHAPETLERLDLAHRPARVPVGEHERLLADADTAREPVHVHDPQPARLAVT